MADYVQRTSAAVLLATHPRHARILGASLVLGTTLAFAGPAHAAQASDHGSESTARDDEPAPQNDADEVRVRGGLSLNGGVLIVPDNPNAYGGVIGLGLRLGVQFTHLVSLYYQNTPFVTLVLDPERSVTAGALDYNTVLLGLTLWNVFDIGIGGGADLIATTVCKESEPQALPDGRTIANPLPDCSQDARVAPGAHLRLALNLGSGPTPDNPRRTAFALGVDVHPSFVIDTGATPVLVTLTAGLGVEWY